MKTAPRLTASERNRALDRLRTVTLGTALASTIAAGGFAYAAALTHPGSSGSSSSASTGTPQTTPTGVSTRRPKHVTGGSGFTSNAAPVPTITTPLLPSLNSATTTNKQAQVSSGGS